MEERGATPSLPKGENLKMPEELRSVPGEPGSDRNGKRQMIL